MYTTILVPTDGGPGTEGAVTRALDLASTFGATVHALSVAGTPPESDDLPEEDAKAARETLEERAHAATIEVQDQAADLDLDVVREVREGTPYRAILEYADEHDVDLVVMGTRSRPEPQGSHLGSTTERVLVRSDVPVLTTRADTVVVPETGHRAYDRVVVPTDGSEAAERAAEHGLTIAERYGADVRVVYVTDTTTYGLGDAPRSIVGLLKEGGGKAVEAVATEARERNVPVSTAVLRGVPGDAILQYVEGAGADMVAMGTRGQSGLGQHFLGSTTARIVRRSRVPVFTVN